MATIFRFLVEDKATKSIGTQNSVSPSGEIVPKKGAGVKLASFTGSNVGVDHNRYLRAVNPVVNSFTGGWWEKGTRMFRATRGVADTAKNSGAAAALTGVGAILIYQFIMMETLNLVRKELKKAEQANQSNYLRIRSGLQVLGRDYMTTKTLFGKINYKTQ